MSQPDSRYLDPTWLLPKLPKNLPEKQPQNQQKPSQCWTHKFTREDIEFCEEKSRENLCHFYEPEIQRLIGGGTEVSNLRCKERLNLQSHGIVTRTKKGIFVVTPEAKAILNIQRIHRYKKP